MITVRGKEFYICEYTGAPITRAYNVPGKRNHYASLPILLRHHYDLMGAGEAYENLKKQVEKFYNQPDIPLSPPVETSKIPLSKEELHSLMKSIDMFGPSWLLVEIPKSDEKKKRKISKSNGACK